MVIYGNPRRGGFVHGCLDHMSAHLEERGVEIDRLYLCEAAIQDCLGCFTCLRSGGCPLADDMPQIIERMRRVDGLLTGASVRNGFFPALYKRFFERICYEVGFGRDLHGKYVLAVGAVGLATGRKALGQVLTMSEFQTHVVDYLFFRTGIPTRLKVADVSVKLNRALDRFYGALTAQRPLSFLARVSAGFDNWIMRKLMFDRNSSGVYDHITKRWREKGLM